MANKPIHGTQTWIKENNKLRIAAYYGSLEKYRAIPDWKQADLSHNSEKPIVLDHGYDESKPFAELTRADLERAAAFRGGKYLGPVDHASTVPLSEQRANWQCAAGHCFVASPRLVLLGGHWCPDCMPNPYADLANPRPWHWDAEAKRNPFFAQLWKPLHDATEDNIYDEHIFDGWSKTH